MAIRNGPDYRRLSTFRVENEYKGPRRTCAGAGEPLLQCSRSQVGTDVRPRRFVSSARPFPRPVHVRAPPLHSSGSSMTPTRVLDTQRLSTLAHGFEREMVKFLLELSH